MPDQQNYQRNYRYLKDNAFNERARLLEVARLHDRMEAMYRLKRVDMFGGILPVTPDPDHPFVARK